MLSRIADALFWIARYMDRAENAARMLDVTYHMLLEEDARGNIRGNERHVIGALAVEDAVSRLLLTRSRLETRTAEWFGVRRAR